MLFSSVLFLFWFLPITLLLYYISPPKLKNTVIFICSLVFYSWGEVRFFPIMIAVILINYLCGLFIGYFDKNVNARRFFLILSIVGSLAMLFYYKYFNFFITNINTLFGSTFALVDNLVLPLGISFYTFQSMSYSIDVYWREVPPERNFISFGAYVVMFPQLVAGPIVRYSEISERLHVLKGRVSLRQISEGIPLFIMGLARKVLVADNVSKLWTDIIGQYSGGVLATPGVGLENASTPLVWLGLIAFTLQIYFDFSGYSLMSIGMGKMLGFDFPQNFNLPYTATSITDFWRRWHMSLSSWFRDYIYIPLGGNRKGTKRQIFNLFVVWSLTGFWHGANWNFIFWGLYYFVWLVVEKLWLLPKLDKGRVWPHIYTLIIVVFGWALFVGSDPGVSLTVLLSKLFVPQGGVSAVYYLRNYAVPLAIGILFASTLPQNLYRRFKDKKLLQGVLLSVLFIACVAYMVAGSYSPFLYFNF